MKFSMLAQTVYNGLIIQTFTAMALCVGNT